MLIGAVYRYGIITACTAVRAEGVHRKRQRERGVDAAGEPEHRAAKPVLAHVVAHAGDQRVVNRLVVVRERRHRRLSRR